MHSFGQETLQDLRLAWRGIRRRPAFALTVVAVLGIGIGAATAVFSVVDRILMRGLPYHQPDSLVSTGISLPTLHFDFLTAASYLELRRDPTPLRAVTSWSGMFDCDLTGDRPARLGCARVEASFVPFFGIRLELGRNFAPDEDAPNSPRVAMISYNLWKNRFAGDRTLPGRKIDLDGQPVQIVGVLPADFELPTLDRADILLPQSLPPNPAMGTRPLRIYGRLAPGMGIAQARHALGSRASQLLTEIPPSARSKVQFHVRPLRDLRQGDSRTASLVLFAAVLGLLLIACANAANLLLARSISRGRELAIRSALGAGRWRIARQVLAETLLLSLAGGVAGCGLAGLLLRLFVAIAPAGMPHLLWAALDLRVLSFGLIGALVCGAAVAIVPVLRGPRADLLSGARTTGPSRPLARNVLVCLQLAVSLVLLTVSGLLLRSLWNRQGLALGVDQNRLVTAQMVLGPRYGQQTKRLEFYEQLLARVRRMPGVDAAALTDSLPPAGIPRTHPLWTLEVEGKVPVAEGSTSAIVLWRAVTPEYFRALGVPLLAGRTFVENDRGASEPAIVLSASLGRNLFGNENPLGRRLRRFRPMGTAPPGPPRPPQPWYTVAGVVADVRNGGLTDRTDPEYYVVRGRSATAFDDAPMASTLVVKGQGPPATLESTLELWIRAEIAALDPALPATIREFREHLGEIAARPRFQAVLVGMFAAIGMLMAAIGLYGLISFTVEQRRREIGVRIALGAGKRQIGLLIAGHALRWTLGGVAVGLIGSAIAVRWIQGLLFHVPAADPISFAGASAVLIALAAAAALVPSRRAAALDPVRILREE